MPNMKSREELSKWIEEKHDGQLIKKTDEPYFVHLLSVANIAENATPWGYEIGLCHDLLEDTQVTESELLFKLIQVGYQHSDAAEITKYVVELTDVFTKESFPTLSKSNRKHLESVRLSSISSEAQTVKYADLIDNISWVEIHNTKRLKKYLLKKKKLLKVLDRGDRILYQKVKEKIMKLLKLH